MREQYLRCTEPPGWEGKTGLERHPDYPHAHGAQDDDSRYAIRRCDECEAGRHGSCLAGMCWCKKQHCRICGYPCDVEHDLKIDLIDVKPLTVLMGQDTSAIELARGRWQEENRNRHRTVFTAYYPESRIHPSRHGDMMARYVEGAIPNHVDQVVFTHSRAMTMRLMRLVCEGVIAPEMVVLWWISRYADQEPTHITATRLDLDSDGLSKSTWPRETDEHDEARALILARRKKTGSLF